MEKQLLKSAFIEALTDTKTVELLAELVGKKLIENKSKPSNFEDELVRKHIIFAHPMSNTGKWMTSGDMRPVIKEMYKDDSINMEIRPRVFGKHVKEHALDSKSTSRGTQYFVEEIVLEVTPEKALMYSAKMNEYNKIDISDVDFSKEKESVKKETNSPDELDRLLEHQRLKETLPLLEEVHYKLENKVKKYQDNGQSEKFKKALNKANEAYKEVQNTREAISNLEKNGIDSIIIAEDQNSKESETVEVNEDSSKDVKSDLIKELEAKKETLEQQIEAIDEKLDDCKKKKKRKKLKEEKSKLSEELDGIDNDIDDLLH